MVESSSHKSSSPKIKEEHVTLDKPESPNPFLPTIQVDFTFNEIAFTTNNEVALIYPSHPNQEYFMAVSDFISKCCLKEAFTRAPTQYKEYLSELWYTAKTLDNSKVWVSTPTGRVRGELGGTTFRNALKAHYLPPSTMYIPPPYITIVRPWFVIVGYTGEIGAKGTLKKSFLPPRWRLLMAQIMHCLGGKTGGLDQISNKDATILYCLANGVHVDYAKIIWVDLIHNLNKKTREKIVPYPSWLSKATNEEGAHPQLSSDSTVEADPGLSAPNDSIPPQQDNTKSARERLKTIHTELGASKELGADEISKKIKLKDLADILKDTRPAFFTPDSVYLLQSKKKELEQAKATTEAEVALVKAKPSYPDINQLTTLLVTSLKPELSKLLASHDFASYFPTELKELPSKIIRLYGEINELKQHIKDMELEKWLPLPSLPGLLKIVTNTLNRFTTLVENALGATTVDVPSIGKATASPAEGEKNTKDADTNIKNELVDLLGIYVVTQYYNKKIPYKKYYEKMKKRRHISKIINCNVLTKKGPISLKTYREDGTVKVIENLKASDLHLADGEM
uniref:Uncharacterized protein n=1 Tax=Tanacetum cinerariifolium TaxID=118510 RepID=A0A6L2N0R4_TANCI|nr:hypothetical protein [Tanacetum cinerariifolium]